MEFLQKNSSSKNVSSGLNKYSNILTITAVSVYVAASVIKSIIYNTGNDWMIRLAIGVACVLTVLLISKLLSGQPMAAAIVSPLVVAVGATVSSVMSGGSDIHFLLLFGCSAMALMHMNKAALLIFFALVNAGTLLIIFGFGISVLNSSATDFDLLTNFVLYNMFNFLLYLSCHYTHRQFNLARERENSFKVILETTPSFMTVIDSQANVECISKSFANWLRISDRRYAVGRPLLDLLYTREMKTKFHSILESDSNYSLDDLSLQTDGVTNWFMVRSSPFSKKGAARFIELYNITEIIEARNNAEVSARTKSDFLANMSHEIRTPMNAIMGMTDLFMATRLNKEQMSHALAIKTASTSLLRIIDDILDLSKIETQSMEIVCEDFEFGSLLNDVVTITGIKANTADIAFTVYTSKDIPRRIYGDEVRLKQILLNLLGNAVKFTRAGVVSLSCLPPKTVGGRLQLTFEVSDTGIGIKEEDMAKLFDDYEQADLLTNRNLLGTGLGLSISKKLASQMGGKITAKSEYGKGSTFTVTVICGRIGSAPLAYVNTPELAGALLYECDIRYSDMLFKMFDELGVSYVFTDNRIAFAEALVNSRFTHVFFENTVLDIISGYISQTKDTVFVQMKDYNERYDIDLADVVCVNKPLLMTTIANIFNSVDITGEYAAAFSGVGGFTTKNVTVLLVDDNLVNLQVAEGLLREFDINVVCASGGQAAIDMVKKHDVDLVFMDYMMPDIDGIDATRKIRGMRGNYEKLPIIALSANAIHGVRDMFLDAGMDDFIPKPIELDKLRAMLLRFLPPEKVITNSVTVRKPN